jgi:Zn-dependent M16 (insulinase) family peptidase
MGSLFDLLDNAGMKLFQAMLTAWIHDADMHPQFDLDGLIAQFQSDLEQNPRLLQDLIHSELLNNPVGISFENRT